MSDVRIVPERVLPIGLGATYTGSLSDSDTYMFRNKGNMILHFKKSGAGACTVTIETPVTIGGLAVAEQTVVVAATTGDEFIGPFPPNIYNDGSHDVRVTLSETTGLTVAALEI